jgi:ZIP family zinc transporter
MNTATIALERALSRAPFSGAGARRLLAASVAALGAAAWAAGQADPRIAQAAIAGFATALATALGAAPALFARAIAQRAQDAMLGFGAGVMLAASAFSLILPAVEAAEALWGSRVAAAGLAACGLVAGALLLWCADRIVPHEHFVKGVEGSGAQRIRRVWLFVFAVTLHNFPEGLAIGTAFGGEAAGAVRLALGIGIQNLPEGLAVALALAGAGYTRFSALAIAATSGLAEPLAALAGAAAVALAQPVLPWALAFAAGAMLFVVSHEIVPESHRRGHEGAASAGVLGGFATMTLLDTALG